MKYKNILLPLSIFSLAAVLLFGYMRNPQTANANPSSESITTNATSTTNSLATTTAQAPFLQSTAATSTLDFDPQNGNIVQVSLAVYSTSTPPIMSIGLETSNNNIDWYSFEEASAAGNPTTLIAGKPSNTWRWSAATTTADETVYKSWVLTTASRFSAAKFARLLLKANGAGATVHAEVAVKKEF